MFVLCFGAKIYFHYKYGDKLEINDPKIDCYLSWLKKGAFASFLLLGLAIIISATYGISTQ